MEVSYLRLLNYPVPEVEQDVDATRAAFYALSVGFGQDPMDLQELAFVDPIAGVVPVPSMVLVMGYPGFWLGHRDLALDTSRIAHVEQQIVLHKPLVVPVRILGRTRVTGLFSRGVGKGLVLQSERQLSDVSDGALVATLRQVHFLQGNSCREAPEFRPGVQPALPSGPPLVQLDLATRPEQALMYRLNGDANPLHSDPSVATAAGFDRPILHGMCTFGFVTRAVIRALCGYKPERICAISMRFRSPVFPGESLRVEIWSGGLLRVRSLERDVVLVDNGRVELSPTAENHAPGALSLGKKDTAFKINEPTS